MDRTTLTSRWTAALLAAVSISATVVVAACGGGGGDSTSDGNSSRWALGPVEGFGSVIVGGVRYDDSNAIVEDEDGTTSVRGGAGLKLGMMVQVSADAPASGASAARARHIRFGSDVIGPVQQINAAGNTLNVLGQKVLVTSSTVFDAAITGGLGGLAMGNVIEVHGLLDIPNGQIVATRIEPKTGTTFYRLRGVVKSLDTTAKTFKIGTETISYASLPAVQVPAALANERIVRVRLNTTQTAGAWVATRLALGARVPDGDVQIEVHGVITVFTSTTSFEINGLKVDASRAKLPSDTSGIKLGARIEVEGHLVNGVLVGDEVEVCDDERRGGGFPRGVELHGTISGLNKTDKVFMLRGITVSFAGAASAPVVYRKGSEADLADGKRVEAKGVLSADRTRMNALVIEFE
jgi:hypothetical protein